MHHHYQAARTKAIEIETTNPKDSAVFVFMPFECRVKCVLCRREENKAQKNKNGALVHCMKNEQYYNL